MRFVVDFEQATPNGGMTVLVDGVPVATSPIPAEAAEKAAAEMHRRYVDAAVASLQHAIGEPCGICDGTGTDYIGRECSRLISR